METGKELAIRTSQMSVTDIRSLAEDFSRSGYFQDAKDKAQAVVKIQAGLELGFGPVYSMTKIYIVKGKVTVAAEVMGAMVKRSGRYDYRISEYTDTAVTLIFTDNGKDVFTSRFTMDDAKKADLLKPDSGWLKWPRAMLMSKALSQGARIVCPHVIAGVYTPEDMGESTNAEGEVVSVTVEETAKPTPETTKAPASPVPPSSTSGDVTRTAVKAEMGSKILPVTPEAVYTNIKKGLDDKMLTREDLPKFFADVGALGDKTSEKLKSLSQENLLKVNARVNTAIQAKKIGAEPVNEANIPF